MASISWAMRASAAMGGGTKGEMTEKGAHAGRSSAHGGMFHLKTLYSCRVVPVFFTPPLELVLLLSD